jgi:hypothetical protein
VREFVKPLMLIVSVGVVMLAVPVLGQNIPAQASGNWEDASTWAGGAVPSSTENVYIGATDPAGAVTTATVTLTAAEVINDAFVGYGSPTNGVLNLNGNTLTITNTLTIGDFNGTGTLTENGGSFTAVNLDMYTGGSSFTFGTADAVTSIDIENGATLSTVASGNITSGGSVANGGTLNLGASVSSSGGFNIEGSGATLNLAGQNFTTGTLWLGYFTSSPVTFERGSTPGVLSLNTLWLGNGQNLPLISADRISGSGGSVNIYTGATLTTAASANISSTVNVIGGTLNLGANMSLGSNSMTVAGSGATLNLAGHNLSASRAFTRLYQFSRGGLPTGHRHCGRLECEHALHRQQPESGPDQRGQDWHR